MKFDYEIDSLLLSLKELSALIVARLVLNESNLASVGPRRKFDRAIENQAIAAAKTLDVPIHVQEFVAGFVHSVADELSYWYATICMPGKPILMQQGTLDLVKSAMKVLDDDKVDRVKRYLLACAVCSQKHIYEIGRQLSSNEKLQLRNRKPRSDECEVRCRSLWKFRRISCQWLDAYKGRVGEQFDGEDLPQRTYRMMIRTVLERGNDINIRFFLKKSNLQRLAKEAIVHLSKEMRTRLELHYSPAALCDMVAKVRKSEIAAAHVEMAFSLQRALINWPYQRFFTYLSPYLVEMLKPCEIWRILFFLIEKIKIGYKDWDYYEMFRCVFEFGVIRRRIPFLVKACGILVTNLVFISNEYLLKRFILSKMPAKIKKAFLLGVKDNGICVYYILNSSYEQLDMFVRGCAMQREDLLVRFKEELMAVYPKCPQRISFHGAPKEQLSDSEWAARLGKVGEIVDKIIAEVCSEEEEE